MLLFSGLGLAALFVLSTWTSADVLARRQSGCFTRIFLLFAVVLCPPMLFLYAIFLTHTPKLRGWAFFTIAWWILALGYMFFAVTSAPDTVRQEAMTWFEQSRKRLPIPAHILKQLKEGKQSLNLVPPEFRLDPSDESDPVAPKTPSDPETLSLTPGIEVLDPLADWTPGPIEFLHPGELSSAWVQKESLAAPWKVGKVYPQETQGVAKNPSGEETWIIAKNTFAEVLDSKRASVVHPSKGRTILFPRSLVWIEPMKALLISARNGGFYLKPGKDSKPPQWSHFGEFAKQDLRGVAFDPKKNALYAVRQVKDQLQELLRLSAKGKVLKRTPLDPPLSNARVALPKAVQLLFSQGRLLVIRARTNKAGNTADFGLAFHSIEPDTGRVQEFFYRDSSKAP